jgi:hypothetical protein
MVEKEYTHIAIPFSLGKKLAKLVGHEGFRNITEVVLWCIREQNPRIEMWIAKIEEKKEETGHEF